MKDAAYLVVEAGVRYWEDATVNGIEDTDGTLIPCREGGLWKPIIRLVDGKIMGWPDDTTADINYKVCDAGSYFLSDPGGNTIAKYRGHYVPDSFLCVGDTGYGDYIIFSVAAGGKIVGWKPPKINAKDWAPAAGREEG